MVEAQSGRMQFSDVAHGIGGELRLRRAFSTADSLTALQIEAALSRSIARVFRVRAEKEMVGPDAGRVVTSMADPQAGRDRPVCEFPGHAMRRESSVLVGEVAVPGSLAGARPQPAFSRLVHQFPEALGERVRCVRHNGN